MEVHEMNQVKNYSALWVGSVLLIISLSLVPTGMALAEVTQLENHTEHRLIDEKMDDFHDAADKGDKVRYLNHFAEDAVFMGTDDWERWPFKKFSEYVSGRFKDGKGWSYKPVQRFTSFSDTKELAWVDEIVESQQWGRFRGTAVLAKTAQGWRLKHYSLTMLVPNEAWPGVSEVTKKAYDERIVDAGVEPASEE